ncbi:MAG: dynamin family protein [Acidobacteriota bacterium]|nr:dynamin family protein [Acidobacteriota bacterium]
MQSAALFVIVGEVKAGKSSFINALLGEEICEVAPDPCTAGIQELVYGEERTKTPLGDHWERIGLPQDVLKDVSIVDTPGINSIIRNYQTITENYLPQSDLVLFVFPAKNPHTAAAWELLTLIRKEWHRKVVFILQQADLATPLELATNRERVRQYARERNVQNPTVFIVSAKREFEGALDSGFAEFRRFLGHAVETGDAWRMKMEGTRDTAEKIVGRLLERLRRDQAAIEDDRAFYGQLLDGVDARREKADALRRLAVDSLCVTYDRLSSKLEQDFADGLRIGTVLRRAIPFLRDKDVKTWLKELQSQFESVSKVEIDTESLRVSKDMADEISSMFTALMETIARRQSLVMKDGSVKDPDRHEILSLLQQKLRDLRIADIVGDKGIQGSDIGKLTLAGGGLAALGAVIALATHLAVLDITGGILALAGAGLVAVTLLWKRTSMIREVSQQLRRSRNEFRDRLDKEIARIFDKLFIETEHRLKEPLSGLNNTAALFASLVEESERIMKLIESISSG